MSAFLPGDLALIKYGEWAGHQVELVQPVYLRAGCFHRYENLLFYSRFTGPGWYLVFTSDSNPLINLWTESDLIPLRGDFSPYVPCALEIDR